MGEIGPPLLIIPRNILLFQSIICLLQAAVSHKLRYIFTVLSRVIHKHTTPYTTHGQII